MDIDRGNVKLWLHRPLVDHDHARINAPLFLLVVFLLWLGLDWWVISKLINN